ncbi:MAG: polysaccharide deacetylase family protein, partial [Betaproteobacteria bacterium]
MASLQPIPSLKIRLIVRICDCLGINRLFYFLNRNRKRILTYHNVLPDAHFQNCLLEGVSHCESVFREQIRSMARLYHFGLDLTDSHQLTLTFDDGYRNQYAVVHPILMQYGIKAYFFCALDLVLKSETLLIDELLLWLSSSKVGTYEIYLPSIAQPLIFDIQGE